MPGIIPTNPGGGGVSGAPWWKPGAGNTMPGAGNTPGGAPSGYTFDPVKGGYTQTIGSAGDVEQQTEIARQRQQAQFAEQQADWNQNRQRQTDMYNRMTQMMNGLNFGSTPGGGGGGNYNAPPPVSFPGGGSVAGPDTSAANAASFGAAKAKAGAMARSSVNSLQSEMADRGILGSGTEARGLTDRLASATNALSDENVAELNKNVDITQHNQDIAAANQRAAFEGNVGQRATDIGAATARRGQDIGLLQSRAALQEQRFRDMMTALGGMNRTY